MPLGFSYASKTLQACVSNQYKAPCKISDYRAQRFLSFRGGALLGLWLDLWLDLWLIDLSGARIKLTIKLTINLTIKYLELQPYFTCIFACLALENGPHAAPSSFSRLCPLTFPRGHGAKSAAGCFMPLARLLTHGRRACAPPWGAWAKGGGAKKPGQLDQMDMPCNILRRGGGGG